MEPPHPTPQTVSLRVPLCETVTVSQSVTRWGVGWVTAVMVRSSGEVSGNSPPTTTCSNAIPGFLYGRHGHSRLRSSLGRRTPRQLPQLPTHHHPPPVISAPPRPTKPSPADPPRPRPRTFRAMPAHGAPVDLVACSRAQARLTLAELFRDTGSILQLSEVGDWT